MDGTRYEHDIPVAPLPISRLGLPQRLVGEAGAPNFEFVITGDDLPSPEALQVSVAEGRVEAVEAVEKGLLVRLALLDSPFPPGGRAWSA